MHASVASMCYGYVRTLILPLYVIAALPRTTIHAPQIGPCLAGGGGVGAGAGGTGKIAERSFKGKPPLNCVERPLQVSPPEQVLSFARVSHAMTPETKTQAKLKVFNW